MIVVSCQVKCCYFFLVKFKDEEERKKMMMEFRDLICEKKRKNEKNEKIFTESDDFGV